MRNSLGRQPNFHSSERHYNNDYDIRPPRSYRHRLLNCIQRYYLHHGCWSVRLLPSNNYSIAMAARLGSIHPASESPFESTIINTQNSTLTWGPFKMPRLVGAFVNGVAIVYMIIVFIFAFWPPALPVGPASMNYACLVFGGTVLLSIVWYIVYARKVYQGPVVEIER